MKVLVLVIAGILLLSGCSSGKKAEESKPETSIPSSGCSTRIAEDYEGPIPRSDCNPLKMTPVQLQSSTAQRYETVAVLTSAAQDAGWSCGTDAPVPVSKGIMECEPKLGTVKFTFFVMEGPEYPTEFADRVEDLLSTPAPEDKLLYAVIGPNWIIQGLFGLDFVPTIPSQLHLGGEVRKIPTHPYSTRSSAPAG